MKRQALIGAAMGAGILLAAFLLMGYFQPVAAELDYRGWSPTAEAIRSRIGVASAPNRNMNPEKRRDEFCTMFKNRFRHHEPSVAIGLRFLAPNRIKLMCPARMEPCYIDRVALAAWHEAQDVFGQPIDIDIYDTFIGTTKIKIGQLRASPKDPKVALVTYDYREVMALNKPLPPRRRSTIALPVRGPRPVMPFESSRQRVL